jgi:hypothetical protein
MLLCSIRVRIMGEKAKRKPQSLMTVIKDVELAIKIPDKTEVIKPMKSPVPGLKTEKTEIGVAEIEGKKTIYLKIKLNGGL